MLFVFLQSNSTNSYNGSSSNYGNYNGTSHSSTPYHPNKAPVALEEILEENSSGNETSSPDDNDENEEKVLAHCDEIPLTQTATFVNAKNSFPLINGYTNHAEDTRLFSKVGYRMNSNLIFDLFGICVYVKCW